MMFCPNCGKELPETAKFCTDCGTALNRAAAAQEETAATYMPEASAPQAESPAETASATEPAATEDAPEAKAVVEEAPVSATQPEAEPVQVPPPMYTATAYMPPAPEPIQQPAAAYQAPAQSDYGQGCSAASPVPAKTQAKKSTVPMILTFVALGLAILIFLLTAFVLFPGQKQGDARLNVYDLEGSWNASFNIRGEDYSGDSVSMEMLVRMDMEYSDAYGYEEYMLVTMTPVAVTENGVPYSQSEMAELEGASKHFYALLEAGTLHFYFPSEDMDILISVPMSRNSGKCRVEFDEYDYSGQMEFTMQR